MFRLRLPMITLLGTLMFIGCYAKTSEAQTCDDLTSRLVARAYVLSIPVFFKENDLIPLINANRAYFLQGGRAIRCMQRLGTALTQSGLAAGSQFKDYSATEKFGGMMPEGLEHLPGQVDSSLRSYGSDMLAMGQELLWLAQVLPPVSRGDYGPYNTTGTLSRQTAVQVMPIYQMLCQMDPGICQMIQNMMIQVQPVLEQQIYNLCRQLGN